MGANLDLLFSKPEVNRSRTDIVVFLLNMSSDDRFIAKELSKAELSAMATFAPAYFEYMASTISAGVSPLSYTRFDSFH